MPDTIECPKCGTPLAHRRMNQHNFRYCVHCEIAVCPRCGSQLKKTEREKGTFYDCSNQECPIGDIWVWKPNKKPVRTKIVEWIGTKIGSLVLFISFWAGFAIIIQSLTNSPEAAIGVGMGCALWCLVLVILSLGGGE